MVLTTKLVTILAAIGFLNVACSNNNNTPAARQSNLGESCQSTSECAGSYVCRGSVCAVSTVGITPNNKVCELVQCTTAQDCCLTPSQFCPTYAADCEAGVTAECTYYQENCVCDTTLNTCTGGQCVSTATCTVDTDCTRAGLTHCLAGKCVACAQDSQCPTGDVCVSNVCVPSCATTADCQAFYDCENSSCVFKGCTENRECIVDLDNPQAFCNQAVSPHTCSAPCVNDVACFNPQRPTTVGTSGNDYSYQLCIGGNCQNAGCDTDDECKALLEATIATAKTAYPHATAQCVTP